MLLKNAFTNFSLSTRDKIKEINVYFQECVTSSEQEGIKKDYHEHLCKSIEKFYDAYDINGSHTPKHIIEADITHLKDCSMVLYRDDDFIDEYYRTLIIAEANLPEDTAAEDENAKAYRWFNQKYINRLPGVDMPSTREHICGSVEKIIENDPDDLVRNLTEFTTFDEAIFVLNCLVRYYVHEHYYSSKKEVLRLCVWSLYEYENAKHNDDDFAALRNKFREIFKDWDFNLDADTAKGKKQLKLFADTFEWSKEGRIEKMFSETWIVPLSGST